MTRDEAEKLKVGDLVYYCADKIRGTVTGVQYKRGVVTIDIVWSDASISNVPSEDMAEVDYLPPPKPAIKRKIKSKKTRR